MMRLVLQAQTPEKQSAILEAWPRLAFVDRSILSEEMARTGIEKQVFDRGPAFKQMFGPAFLVYYSPAFLRNLTPSSALEALRILAEVYRRARELWPLRPSTGNAHAVTVRIDQIKELKVSAIDAAYREGQAWVLERKNDNEAVIECHELSRITQLAAQGVQSAALKLWSVKKPGRGRSGSECSGDGSRSGKSSRSGDGASKNSGTSSRSSVKSDARRTRLVGPNDRVLPSKVSIKLHNSTATLPLPPTMVEQMDPTSTGAPDAAKTEAPAATDAPAAAPVVEAPAAALELKVSDVETGYAPRPAVVDQA